MEFWRAGMSPLSSPLLVLHVREVTTRVTMQSRGSRVNNVVRAGRDSSAGRAARRGCWLDRADAQQSTYNVRHMWAGQHQGSRGVGGRRQEEDKTQDPQQMHGYDLNHINLGICDRQAVKHGFQDTHLAFSTLHSGCPRTQLTYTPTMLAHTHNHTRMHFYMHCILKASMFKAHMEHTTRCRVHLCV